MPRVLAFGDIVQARLYCRVSEQVTVTTHNWLVDDFGPTSTDRDAANTVDAALSTPLLNLLSGNATYLGTCCQIINRPPLGVHQCDTGGAGTGNAGAISLPRQTAGLISWNTGMAGPGGRGRTYMPFPAAADNETDGTPTASYLTRLNLYAQAVLLIGDFNGGGRIAGVSAVLLRRRSPPSTSLTVPLAGYELNDKWATQKRRGSFGRPNSSPI